MFFIDEKPEHREYPLKKQGLEGPEPDALRQLDQFREDFSSELPSLASLTYTRHHSLLSPHRGSGADILRAIGGATYEERKKQDAFSRSMFANPDRFQPDLLDQLALNLLHAELKQTLGYSLGSIQELPPKTRSPRRKIVDPAPLFFDELSRKLTSPLYWARIEAQRNGTKEMIFSITIAGIKEKLIFVASRTGLNGHSEIKGIKLTGAGKPRSIESNDLKYEIQYILNDQIRRNKLAYLYGSMPRVKGLPAAIRSKIKHELESVGIPSGTYSREGFSSGRFPFPKTYAEISDIGHEPGAALVFSRCPRCTAVTELSMINGTHKQSVACLVLTADEISPWHSSFCDAASGDIYYPDAALYAAEEGMELRTHVHNEQRSVDFTADQAVIDELLSTALDREGH